MESKKVKHIIYTHVDCDGLCAAAITINGLMDYKVDKEDIEVIFTQSYHLPALLSSIENKEDPFLKLYLLDLACSEDTYRILSRFSNVVVIDHHRSSLNLLSKVIRRFECIVDIHRSTSSLTQNYFGLKGSRYFIRDGLSLLGSVCDKTLIVSNSNKILTEANLLRKALLYALSHPDYRYYFLEYLIDGTLPSHIPGIDDISDKVESKINTFLDTAETNKMRYNKFIISHLSDMHGAGYAGIVASKMATAYKLPVFIMFKDDREDVIVITARCHKDNKLNLNYVISFFEGGGHRMAAGGIVRGTTDYYNVAKQIKDVVNTCRI